MFESDVTDPTCDSRSATQVLADRRSCTGFGEAVVSLGEIRTLAETAGLTPSEQDLQPWRIHVAQGATLERVCTTLLHSNVPKALAAGTALVISGDMATIDESPVAARFYSDRPRRDFVMRNVSMYLMSLMLAAESRGLATRPMAGFDEAALAEICDLAPSQVLVAVLLIGRSDGSQPQERTLRRSTSDVISCLDASRLP